MCTFEGLPAEASRATSSVAKANTPLNAMAIREMRIRAPLNYFGATSTGSKARICWSQHESAPPNLSRAPILTGTWLASPHDFVRTAGAGLQLFAWKGSLRRSFSDLRCARRLELCQRNGAIAVVGKLWEHMSQDLKLSRRKTGEQRVVELLLQRCD